MTVREMAELLNPFRESRALRELYERDEEDTRRFRELLLPPTNAAYFRQLDVALALSEPGRAVDWLALIRALACLEGRVAKIEEKLR